MNLLGGIRIPPDCFKGELLWSQWANRAVGEGEETRAAEQPSVLDSFVGNSAWHLCDIRGKGYPEHMESSLSVLGTQSWYRWPAAFSGESQEE